MKGAVADTAVAEESDADAIGFEELEGVTGACSLENVGADDAGRPHHAHVRGEEVHATAAAVRTAGGATEELGDELT